MNNDKPRMPVESLVQLTGRIAHLGGFIVELDSGRIFWSDEVCDIHEVPHGTSPTLSEALAYYPPEYRQRATELFETCATQGVDFDEEFQIVIASGKRVWVRAIAEAVYGPGGGVVRVQGAFQDITASKESEEQRQTLATRLAATLESVSDAILVVDHEWRIRFLNDSAERLLRCPRADVMGINIWERFPEAVGGRYYNEYHRAKTYNCLVAFEEYYEPLDLWTEIRAYPCEDGLAIYFLDISERKAAEAKIHKLAYYDQLTGLPNRQMLLARLTEALAASQVDRQYRAVMLIDLDNFKSINDTRGHVKGDILLKMVTDRLLAAAGSGDQVVRLGGDEFVILMEGMGSDPALADIRARGEARAILDCFAAGFEIDGIEQFSTASIGVALFDGESATTDELLQRADLAMYRAKAAGRNAFALFMPDMQSRLTDRVALEADLRQALAGKQFVLHYQPLAEVDGGITGAEALVRWNHPVRGMVPPFDFIPLAEDTGMILALGRWVLHTSCTLLARWGRDDRTAHLTMAVNVSAHQLHRPDFVELVMSVLAETGASPRRLKLELTESLLVDDVEGTIVKMQRLKDVGVRFSLDDFGTGYSSLSYLHRLPLSTLKIDKSFVRDACNGQQGAVIARTILALGDALDLAVLAEGVETTEQYDFIAAAGCREYQGYLYSRPLPEAALSQFIADNHRP